MDPRRELVALQIAATQQANALTAAAAAAVLSAQCNEENKVINGDVDLNNVCAVTRESLTNGVGTIQDITTISVPMPLPIAATIITSQGVFTATHNPRSLNRINLLNPHSAPVPTPASALALASTLTPIESSSAITDPHTVLDGRDTYSICASSAVSTEGARVVSNVNIMESWRSKVQSHAVRLMNQRGDTSHCKYTKSLKQFLSTVYGF